MTFAWDENKNRLNIQRHGVSFEQAAFVFKDARRQSKYDATHSLEEDRYIVIGYANASLLFVVHTEIEEDTIRIISARKATKKEREAYHGHGKTFV
jgi:uncharacterized DUF497 family protein